MKISTDQCFGAVIALLAITRGPTMVASFAVPHSHAARTANAKSVTAVFLSDVPQDDSSTTVSVQETKTGSKPPSQQSQPQQPSPNRELQLLTRRRNSSNNNNNDQYHRKWLPEPPEDILTLAGDVASLMLYAFTDHYLNHVVVSHILASSASAADAAKALDPSGLSVTLASTPVWLDAGGAPQLQDQVLLWDLQSKVTPQWTPLLESAGGASVALASCWILAGLVHQAFHFRNTLDCSTHRAVAVTGQTWVTCALLLMGLACLTSHLDASAVSTSVLMGEGRILSPLEEGFRGLTRSDADYVVNSLGVVLTWRFLVSYLLGGWSK